MVEQSFVPDLLLIESALAKIPLIPDSANIKLDIDPDTTITAPFEDHFVCSICMCVV